MKKIIALGTLAVILSFATYPQTTEAPDGAAGVKYWMSSREVKTIWKTKGTLFSKYEKILTRIGLLSYTDMMVGTEEFDMVIGKFLDNKLYDITMSKYPMKDDLAEDIYDDLKELLISIYPNGQSFRKFESPYIDRDGREMEAVRLEKGTIVTYWVFQDSTIALSLESLENYVIVELKYQYTALATEAAKIYDAVNDNEF